MSDLYTARMRIFSAAEKHDRLELMTGLLMIFALAGTAGVLWIPGEWMVLGRVVSTIWMPVICLPLAIGAFWGASKARRALKEARLDLDAALIGAGLKPSVPLSLRHPWRV